MTHPLVHFLVPVIGLLLLRFDKRLVLMLSPLALLPDLDYFIPPHRAWGHSIFFAAILIALGYLVVRRLFPEHKSRQVLIVASVMVLSHLLLDGNMAWLYPLSDARFGYRWDLGTFMWQDGPIPSDNRFSWTYKALQVTGIFAAALLAFFWPSSARPRQVRSGRQSRRKP